MPNIIPTYDSKDSEQLKELPRMGGMSGTQIEGEERGTGGGKGSNGSSPTTTSLKTRCRRVLKSMTFQVTMATILGIAIGLALSFGKAPKNFVFWVEKPGILLTELLKCILLPMVFINVILVTIDVTTGSSAFAIGWRTFCFYIFTGVLASTQFPFAQAS